MISRRRFNGCLLAGAALKLAACRESEPPSAAVDPPDQTDLLIWWEHGYLPEENEGIIRLVQSFEKATGKKALLKLVPDEFIGTELPKIQEGHRTTPDLVFSIGFTTQHAPHLAWTGALRDLTELIEPVRERYRPEALAQVRYLNRDRGDRGYYALPIGQSDDFIHYWRPGLEILGLRPSDVPLEWDAFWPFWCHAQDATRRRGEKNVFGLGLCLSNIGFDFYTTLMLFGDAHAIQVASEHGFVPLYDGRQREGLTEIFAEIAGLYRRGYIPPAALNWSGSGNNNSFLEGEVLMTHNLTLSIPVTQKQARNPYNWDALQRYAEIVTLDQPLRIGGRSLPSRKNVKQIIAPVGGRNGDIAMEFLRFLLADNHLRDLVQGFKGRIWPVMEESLSDPFWNAPDDPHFSAAMKLQRVPSRLSYEVIHPLFSDLQGRQVWAETLRKIVREGFSPERAIAWLLAEAAAAQRKFQKTA